MPAFIKTPKDEARWAKAKKAANKTLSESDGDSYWALTNSIYQKMNKSDPLDNVKEILAKAKRRITDEYDPEAESEDEDNAGMHEFDPDQEGGDDADEWLNQNDPAKAKSAAEAGSEDDEGAGRGPDSVRTEKTPGKSSSTKAKVKDLDPERLKNLKGVSKHWLDHMDQVKKQTADARKNPHLFAEGHRSAAHNTSHENFNDAYAKHMEDPAYQKMTATQKMRADAKFKKDFQTKNPDYHKNAAAAASKAHEMHGKASELHGKEIAARKNHILSGGQGVSPGDTFSAEEAAQHVGGSKDDEGNTTASTHKDPAAAFASKYSQHLAGETKPKVNQADEYEELQNPDKNVRKHPALSDPKNKKMIEDLFNEYHPVISSSAHRARAQAVANGVPEDKIDMGDLHEAGMHGLMQAVHDYSPDVGASFKTHARAKMQGLMQSKLAGQDYIPRDMRSKMKAKESGVLPSTPALTENQAVSTPSAPASNQVPTPKAHEVIASSNHSKTPEIQDRHKRITTLRKK